MFGLFKPKLASNEPVGFELAIKIAAPACEVYPLLDWADQRHAKRQLGDIVEQTGENTFRLVLKSLPDNNIPITVEEAFPHSSYTFLTRIEPVIGALVSSRESYTITDDGSDACILALSMEAQFLPDMREKDHAREIAMMAASAHSALEKLKIHAEYGTDAVRAVEDRLVI